MADQEEDLAPAWQEAQDLAAQQAEDEASEDEDGYDDPNSEDEDMAEVVKTFTIEDFITNEAESLEDQLKPFTQRDCVFDLKEEKYGYGEDEWELLVKQHLDYVLFKGASDSLQAQVRQGGSDCSWLIVGRRGCQHQHRYVGSRGGQHPRRLQAEAPLGSR